MIKHIFILLASGLVVSGCLTSGGDWGSEGLAWYHMHIADSLEQVSAFQPAAQQYLAVAEDYPQSSYYPVAVRKAALLYASDYNSARSDSIALRWLNVYLSFSLSRAERENVQAFVSVVQRLRVLHEEIFRQNAVLDSLASVSKRQASTLIGDAHRLQELELEVQQAQGELKKIKEFDLRLSKSRVRK